MKKALSYLRTNFIRPKPNNKPRIEWVDVAKGVGIFLVFYGHIMYKSSILELNTAIYAFHVSFFFILSGFVFKLKDETTFLSFLKSKIIRILIPFIIFNLIGCWVAMKYYNITDMETIKNIMTFYTSKNKYNKPVYFLIVLFGVYLISYFIDLPNRKPFSKLGIAITFLAIGNLIYTYMHFSNSLNKIDNLVIHYCLDRMVIATGFFALGSFFTSIRNLTRKNMRMPLLKPLLVPSVLLWIIYGVSLNTKASLYKMNMGNYWYFVISSIFGSIVFIIFSIYISKSKIVRYITSKWSQNTILIMGTHHVAAIGIVAYYLEWLKPIWFTWQFDLCTPFFVLGCLMGYSFILCPIVDRYLPIVSGKEPYFYKELFNRIKNKIVQRKQLS